MLHMGRVDLPLGARVTQLIALVGLFVGWVAHALAIALVAVRAHARGSHEMIRGVVGSEASIRHVTVPAPGRA